jgi:molybdopterin converting factor small subunit
MTGAAGTISVKLFAGLELRARERRTDCERDQALGPDDEVALFPRLGGG